VNIDYDLGGRITAIEDNDAKNSSLNAPAAIDCAEWRQRPEHLRELVVTAEDCDALGHTNNVVYLRWLEVMAWQHSAVAGLDWPAYQRLNRAMVARHHDITYLQATVSGDRLWLATWREFCDGRLRFRRGYQIINVASRKTVLQGTTEWVCVRVDNGRAARMPAEFVAAYSPC